MKVQVCVSAEKVPDFVSLAIMRFLRWPASHIFLVYDDVMYHAVGEGVRSDDFREFCKDHHITDRVEVDLKCTPLEFASWFQEHQGIEYSDSQYLGFMVPFVRFLVRNGRKKAICSEFVSWAMIDFTDMDKALFEDADFKNPKEVLEAIKRGINGRV